VALVEARTEELALAARRADGADAAARF